MNNYRYKLKVVKMDKEKLKRFMKGYLDISDFEITSLTRRIEELDKLYEQATKLRKQIDKDSDDIRSSIKTMIRKYNIEFDDLQKLEKLTGITSLAELSFVKQSSE